MNAPNSAPCELLPWDTDFFHCRIARVCGNTLEPKQAIQIDEWSRNNRIQGLYFLSRVDDPVTVQTAEQHDFGLVDIRIALERVMANSHEPPRPDPPAGVTIRPVQPADLPGLQAMARAVHRETRFFNDSHFPRQRAEDLYSTWITLESQGRAQAMLVAASAANQPLGYITCHLAPSRREAQIGLVGVSPEVHGQGIGSALVLAAMYWYWTQGAHAVTVVTQGRNHAGQRLYQRCGFLSRDLQLWYHKWYSTQD